MKNPTLLVFLLLVSGSVESALYRWVDDAGRVHYSDKVPPKAAQNGHAKLNKNGTTKETVDSAASRKQKLLNLLEEKRRQKALNEAKKKQQLQEMQDAQLISMFSSTKELSSVYNNKIQRANGAISVLKARHKKLSDKLEVIEERYERTVNPADKRKLGMKVEDMLDNLHIYQQAITENLIERGDIKARFKRDLTRYQEITPNTESSD